MDEASSSIDQAESSTAAIYARNDDDMTRDLRAEGLLDMNGLIQLYRTKAPVSVASSSLGTLTTTVFSSNRPSTSTKPTSAGTLKGKGKAKVAYDSSASATHGSGSDTEIETARDSNLAFIGDWAGQPALKGPSKSRKRCRHPRRQKSKKPVVIIQADEPAGSASEEDNADSAEFTQVSRRRSKELKYLRKRRDKPTQDEMSLAEQGFATETTTLLPATSEGLSRTRFYAIVALGVAILLTCVFAGFAARKTGKAQMHYTQAIVLVSFALISFFTVLARVLARRALQEALLAGSIVFLFGYILASQLHEFM